MSLLPLNKAPIEMLAGLTSILSDIDDTLTLHGRLPAVAFAALEKLRGAGLKIFW